MESETRYPKIKVKLSGEDGNAFAIISRVSLELRRAGVPLEIQKEFKSEAMSGDYNNVIATASRWVTIS